MNLEFSRMLFTLLRCALCETKLTEAEKAEFSEERISQLLSLAKIHDVAHLVALALKKNGLLSEENVKTETCIFNAVYRHEHLSLELARLCDALEAAEIPFLPLKGSVLRRYYPEPWMRTSCDLDILVRKEDLKRAVIYLKQQLAYTERERGTHDVSLDSPTDVHVELHFDLVEEEYAQNAIDVLNGVWDKATLHENSQYWYEMPDDFFYFYHVAHMAKHFENGGCGIRSFLDLWILDRLDGVDLAARDRLLAEGELLQFANASRRLSRVWFEGETPTRLLLQMQSFLLRGGSYGSSENRVALAQKKRGGRVGYVVSRIFIPFAKLKRYYPILEKHPWLMPLMQVRRWFMLLRPDVARMARSELEYNRRIDHSEAAKMDDFLKEIGL